MPAESRHLALHEGHIICPREDEKEFIVSEVAEVVAMLGEPDELNARTDRLENAGPSDFAFQIMDDDPV